MTPDRHHHLDERRRLEAEAADLRLSRRRGNRVLARACPPPAAATSSGTREPVVLGIHVPGPRAAGGQRSSRKRTEVVFLDRRAGQRWAGSALEQPRVNRRVVFCRGTGEAPKAYARPEHGRQQERRDRGDDAEAERACQRVAAAAGQLHEAFQVAQAEPRGSRHLLADRGDDDAAVGPFDELHAEQLFEILDGDAEGGLRHEACRRRTAEMPVLGERREIAELARRRQAHAGRPGARGGWARL